MSDRFAEFEVIDFEHDEDKLIGQGAYGMVFDAKNIENMTNSQRQKKFVVKIMKGDENELIYEEQKKTWSRELQILIELKEENNIAQIEGYKYVGRDLHLLLEKIDGPNLEWFFEQIKLCSDGMSEEE